MEENLVTTTKYYWGCCTVCRKAGSAENPLKRCSRCSCMFYCSAEHQKLDWKAHKKLCSYLATAAAEVGADNFFGQEIQSQSHEADNKTKTIKSWAQFRVNAIKMCKVLMGRELEPFEKEVFLFPRACRVCRLARRDGMVDCYRCQGVTYCSLNHYNEHIDGHRRSGSCNELKYAMVCDNFESTVSIAAPPVPSHLDKAFNHLTSMEDHLAPQSAADDSNEEVDLANMEYRFLTERLTGPLTIAYAGSRYGLAGRTRLEDSSSLVIHVVGSNIMEMLGLLKWEYVVHRLPNLASVRFVFVGLELPDDSDEGECPGFEPCHACQDQGRSIVYEIRRLAYKEYCEGEHFTEPDMVCAFNCGFHEFSSQPELDTWSESIPFLTRRPGAPLVFTSYTLNESLRDLDLVERLSEKPLSVDVRTVKNPFSSLRPVRDFECDNDCDVFYSNQYMSIVRSS